MQIHELTKRQKQVDEGILDSVKAAVNAATTGYKTGSAATGGSKVGGAAGALGAATSPGATAIARNQVNLNKANKDIAALNKKYGWDISPTKRGAGETFAGQQQQQANQQLAKQITQQFVKTPDFNDLAAVLPDPGKVLTVTTANKGNYFKDTKGVWYAENGQVVPATNTVELEKLIDADQYDQVAPPGFLLKAQVSTPATQAAKKAKAKQPATATPAAEPAAPLQEAAPAASRVAKIKSTVNTFTANKTSGIQRKYKTNMKQVLTNPTTQAQLDQAMAQLINASNSKVAKGKKQKVAQAFQQYVALTLNGIEQIGTGEVSVSEPAQQTNQFATPAQQQTAERQIAQLGVDPKAIDTLKKLAQNPQQKPIVKNAIGLAEGQVAISKDIHVKTSAGTYIKRHQDQQWYDPNGVLIDPEKYADYITKLDNTPAAQTRYLADLELGMGSADSFIKNKSKEAPKAKQEPEAEIPQLSPAEIQAIRAKDLNKQTDAAYNALQAGTIMGVGQDNEELLKNRLFRQMAMK